MNNSRGARADRDPTAPAVSRRRLELRADCGRCAALCCAGPAFSKSAEFAIDKPAGQPCPHLTAGFRGCAAFDCLGAGQQVVQVTFGGSDWRTEPAVGLSMFEVFAVMRRLYQLLWHLNEALALRPADQLASEVDEAYSATERLAGCRPEELVALDVEAHHGQVNEVLLRVSEHVRERA